MSNAALAIIAEHLSADDDPQLWEVAIRTLLAEAADAAAEVRTEVYAEVGCCHHWISPHRPIRWTADGGFAWPFGYNKTVTGSAYRASPEFTWSERSVDGRGLGAGPNGTAMSHLPRRGPGEDRPPLASGDPHDLDASLSEEQR